MQQAPATTDRCASIYLEYFFKRPVLQSLLLHQVLWVLDIWMSPKRWLINYHFVIYFWWLLPINRENNIPALNYDTGEHRNTLCTKANTPLEADRATLLSQAIAGGSGPGVDAATAVVVGGRVRVATQQHSLSLQKRMAIVMPSCPQGATTPLPTSKPLPAPNSLQTQCWAEQEVAETKLSDLSDNLR